VSVLAAVPTVSHGAIDQPEVSSLGRPSLFSPDPNGTKWAFNSTFAHFDLYTLNNVTFISPSSNITWFSRFNNTVNGVPIPNTAFLFNITSSSSVTRMINYSLNIPKGTGSTTFLKFDWNGTIGSGTGARYLLSNSTKVVLNIPKNSDFTGGPPLNSTGNIPLSCGPSEECFDVTKFVGFNLTLTFLFNSTSASGRLAITVSNIEVASVNDIPTPASSHYMSLNSNDSTDLVHHARAQLVYNSTTSYARPNLSGKLNHTWGQMIITFFLPSSYRLDNVTLDGVTILPATYVFKQGSCTTKAPLECTGVTFTSLSMTAPLDKGNRTAIFVVQSVNAISSVQTILGNASTDFWTPGENMTLRVRNQPGVNLTGTQAAWFTDPRGIFPVNNMTLSTAATRGLDNYTVTLPSSPLGAWTLTTVFQNTGGFDKLPFDYGIMSHSFRIEELQLKSSSFAATGGVGRGASLNIIGSLMYASDSSSASNLNATVFAVASGPGASLVSTTVTASTGLYISNMTMVNGIGTVRTPITLYISIVNPTGTNGFNANLTVEHEWAPGFAHGVNATIPLKMGDEPFNNTRSFTYSVQATIDATGLHLQVQSLATDNKKTADMTIGSSAVPFLRQHSGLFKMTLHTKNLSNNVTATSIPLESPPYAYLLYAPIIPGRLLAYSTTTTSSTGSFSTMLGSDRLVGVKRLLIIVLARDANGVTLGDVAQDPSAAKDSTILTSTADIPGDATVQQQVTATLHLKSNATAFPIALSVNLNITGSGSSAPIQPKTVTIAPGITQDLSFSFAAPATPGTYLVTFSSPQYGAAGSVLLSKTLQVSLVASNLQILIPVLIGLVAAIVIVGVYLLRKEPAEEEGLEKTKPAPSKSSKASSGPQPRNA